MRTRKERLRKAHKVYLLVELLISGEVDEEPQNLYEDYHARVAELDDVLNLSGDFTRDLDKDIEESIDANAYEWNDIVVKASVLGLLKTMPRNRVY